MGIVSLLENLGGLKRLTNSPDNMTPSIESKVNVMACFLQLYNKLYTVK